MIARSSATPIAASMSAIWASSSTPSAPTAEAPTAARRLPSVSALLAPFEVRKAMTEVLLALQTGSLYDAIAEAKAIPVESKDETFLSDARLLLFINKIETYLEVPLSTVL